MRVLARIALATALVVPVGLAVAAPAQAAPPVATCHRSTPNGNLVATPGFKLLVKLKQDYTLASPGLKCTGGTVLGANITLDAGEPIAVNCSTVIGLKPKSGSSHGLLTWTAPKGTGSSHFHAYIKVTGTSGHTTTATIKGVINTSPANTLFAGHTITGTVHLNKGLKQIASGGDCKATSKLKNFPINSINFTIN